MKDTTIFRKALGDSPVIRVLDFLIEGRGLDYSLTDIAEHSNIGWTTLHRIWDTLVQMNIVVPTREIGKAKLFKLNQENPAVEKLITLYDTLLYLENEKYFTPPKKEETILYEK
jgi:DNA-binding transcriptional ArsR family regulator